jgi:hypothetical protein
MPAATTTIASFPTTTGNGADPDGQLFIDPMAIFTARPSMVGQTPTPQTR